MKTRVEVKRWAVAKLVLGDFTSEPAIPLVMLVNELEFTCHPSNDQPAAHINEVARRFVEEFNKP